MSRADGTLDEKLLNVLACPLCKAGVKKLDENTLVCNQCGKKYEVKDGVPHMLVTEEEIKNHGSKNV